MSTIRTVQQRAPGQQVPPADIQELWFATLRHSWTSLAVIPADENALSAPIADMLAEVGTLTGRPARVIYADGAELSNIASLVMDLDSAANRPSSVWTSGGTRRTGAGGQTIAEPAPPQHTIVALGSVAANPLLLPIVLSVSGVLLVVHLGETQLDTAKHTIELVGRDRIFGCVLVRP